MNLDIATYKGLEEISPRGFAWKHRAIKIVETFFLGNGKYAEAAVQKAAEIIPADFVPKKERITETLEALEREMSADADFMALFIYVNELHVFSAGSASVFLVREGEIEDRTEVIAPESGRIAYSPSVIIHHGVFILLGNRSFTEKLSKTELQIAACKAADAREFLDELLLRILSKEEKIDPDITAKVIFVK